jgi:hypothetical protein
LIIRTARCPGCKTERDVDAQQGLRAAELAIHTREKAWLTTEPPADAIRALAMENNDRWFWACDECLTSGRAIAADVTKVNVSMGAPFAAYVDRPFRCEDCHADVVFSASEQKHWYETLGFLIWVYPKQCIACRKKRHSKRRANQALAGALANLDTSDPTQLDAIAKLYDEIGSAKKAAEFRGRAKNKRR